MTTHPVSSVVGRRTIRGMETNGSGTNGLGGYVRARRDRNGWSLTSLAARSGLSKSELSAIEAGKIKLPGADKRRRLAEALSVRHVDLLVAAGEITADEAGEGTIPAADRPEVEAVCAALRRVSGDLTDT